MADKSTQPEEPEFLQSRSGRRGLWIGVAAIVVVIAIVAAGFTTGWFGLAGSTSPGPRSSVTLTGAGSTFVYPLMTAWATTYKGLTGVTVNYQGIGSGGGINGVTQKTLDFGATDAPLTPANRAVAPTLLTIPESLGAVTMSYNVHGVTGGLNLTGDVIAGIYLGQITNWNDAKIAALNSGLTLPNLAILVAHRADASGTTFAFTDYLSRVNQTWKTTVGTGKSVNWPVGVGAQGNPGVAAVVQGNNGAIGYVELAYALLNSFTYAKVQNRAGNWITPTLNSTAAAAASYAGSLPPGNGDWGNVSIANAPGADSYPISTFTYLLVYSELNIYGSSMTQTTAKALVDFVWWIVHDGQSQASSLAYVPLPASVVTLNEQTIGSITYNGQTLHA